jgi:hypothetical protein
MLIFRCHSIKVNYKTGTFIMLLKNMLLASVFGTLCGTLYSTDALSMDDKNDLRSSMMLPSERSILAREQRTATPIQPVVTTQALTAPNNTYIEPFAIPGQGMFGMLFEQDTSVQGLGMRTVYVPHAISKATLADREFTLSSRVRSSNRLSVEPYSKYDASTYAADEKRAISIWTTARLGADILRQDYVDMIRLTSGKQTYNQALVAFYTNWKKGLPPVMIYQNDGVDMNAFYNRTSTTREMRYFHFISEADKKTTIFTGESSDIVIHECMHAHLDEMCPWFFDSNSLELGGFHEGHADSMSLTLNLAISPNQRQTLLAQTGGNLHMKGNFLSRLGEQFGAGIGSDSVRNLDVDAILGQVDQEVHDLGRIWASGTYDILADAYPVAQKALIHRMSEEQILLHASTYLRRLENLSVILQTSREPGFTNFASTMNMLAQENVALTGIAEIDALPWEDYIKNQYTRRKVPVNGGSGKAQLFNINFSKEKVNLCGTVHNHLTKQH